jgi:alanine racemase
MSIPSSLPLRCWAEIDLAALERNLLLIRSALPSHMRYVAVVKADAYGHGLPQIAARLMHAGADLFAVANLAEAAALREVGPDWPILILGALLPDEMRFVPDYGVAVTVSSTEEVEQLDRAAARQHIDVHLKIDTGMGRLGAWHENVHPVYTAIRNADNLRLAGVFTHFSSSDDDPAFTTEQRRRFLHALEHQCPGYASDRLLVHADNSAGLETIESAGPFNAVRVGLLQFGILPGSDALLTEVHAEPVFSFRTRVGLVKSLPAGTGISYGRTHVLRRPSRIAILTAGYGDGIPRTLSNRGQVLIHGTRCPILGRVTMDQTIVDVTDLPPVAAGDEAVLVGCQIDSSIPLAEFSRWAETIPWETLCSVTKRVPRLYRTPLGY